jgi:hypothetical protein
MCHTSFKPLRKRHKEKRPRKSSRERLQGNEDIVLLRWRGERVRRVSKKC